jgi:hypothetical protein
MPTLIKNIIHDEKNLKIWHADHIAMRAVAALIFKNLSNQISAGYIIPTVNWNDFTTAQAVWATDDNNNVLGGICFNYNQDFFLVDILCVFENYEYNESVHGYCLEQLKILGKQSGMNGCYQIIHQQDKTNIDRASKTNMLSTFHVFTRSLIDDN